MLIVAENAIHPHGHGHQLAGSAHRKISFNWSWLTVRHTHQMQVEGSARTVLGRKIVVELGQAWELPMDISHAVPGGGVVYGSQRLWKAEQQRARAGHVPSDLISLSLR